MSESERRFESVVQAARHDVPPAVDVRDAVLQKIAASPASAGSLTPLAVMAAAAALAAAVAMFLALDATGAVLFDPLVRLFEPMRVVMR